MSSEPVYPFGHEARTLLGPPLPDRRLSNSAEALARLPERRRQFTLEPRVPIVCARCDVVTRAVLNDSGRAARCSHCGTALFSGRVFDLQAANFDLHIQATRIPTAVIFWAPWSKACCRVLAIAERAARALEPRVRFARVNTDEERDLISRFRVRGIPTLLLFKDAKEAARRIGCVDLNTVLDWPKF